MKKYLFYLLIFINFLPIFSFSQSQEQQIDQYKGTASGTNSYSVTISTITAISPFDGQKVWVRFTNANTGAATLKVNAYSAIAITLNAAALVAGDIAANTYIGFVYNSNSNTWQMSRPGSSVGNTWNTDGNTLGVDTKFLGSVDNFDVLFKTNNLRRASILKGGQYIFGVGSAVVGTETYSFQDGDVYVDDNFLVNNAITTSTRTLFGGGWTITGGATLGVSGTTNGTLVFKNSTNANTLTLNSGVTSASYAVTLPTAQGAANSVLQNNGAGILTWTVPTSSDWTLAGNALTGSEHAPTEFFGSTNNFDVVFRENNSEVFRLYDGLMGLGITAPTAKLHIQGTGSTSATYSLKIDNSASEGLFYVKNNAQIVAGQVGSPFNFYMGYQSGDATGTQDLGIGFQALRSSTGTGNVAIGFQAMEGGNGGSGGSVMIGWRAGKVNAGANNVGVGTQALGINNTGYRNTAIGNSCMITNSDGWGNTATGYEAEYSMISGSGNCAFGYTTLRANTDGVANVAIGDEALVRNASGDYNVALGHEAGSYWLGSNAFFVDNIDRGSLRNDTTLSLLFGNFGGDSTSQKLKINGQLLLTSGINTTAGDAATIQAQSGRFRKDTSGNTFTLTNAKITANSIILLTFASDPGIATHYSPVCVAGAGSATITFSVVPTNDTDVNFLIINNL